MNPQDCLLRCHYCRFCDEVEAVIKREIGWERGGGEERREEGIRRNQRTNGPVNAHLIFWLSKTQNIQNLENIWIRNDLDRQYSYTFIISISCLHLPTFRSQAAIVSEIHCFHFSHRKA